MLLAFAAVWQIYRTTSTSPGAYISRRHGHDRVPDGGVEMSELQPQVIVAEAFVDSRIVTRSGPPTRMQPPTAGTEDPDYHIEKQPPEDTDYHIEKQPPAYRLGRNRFDEDREPMLGD